MKLSVLNHPLKHCRQHRLNLRILSKLLERAVHEIVELFLEQGDVAAAGADDVDDVAVVQQGVEEMFERDVLVAPFHRLVEGEFEGLLELSGDHRSGYGTKKSVGGFRQALSIVASSGYSCSRASAVVFSTFISATSNV